MKVWRVLVGTTLLFAALAGCRKGDEPQSREAARLGLMQVEQASLRSSNFSLAEDSLSRVMDRADSVGSEDALADLLRLAEDEAAESEHLAGSILRGVLVRQLFSTMLDAEALPTPSASEREEAMEVLGTQLVYPRLVRTMRFTVAPQMVESDKLAEQLAGRVLEATKDIADEAAFKEVLSNFDVGEWNVEAIQLPPVDDSGASYVLTNFDAGAPDLPRAYGERVHECSSRGVLPFVIADEHGFHVALCLEVHPAWSEAEPQFTGIIKRHIQSKRAGAKLGRLAGELRGRTKVAVHPKADTLMKKALEIP